MKHLLRYNMSYVYYCGWTQVFDIAGTAILSAYNYQHTSHFITFSIAFRKWRLGGGDNNVGGLMYAVWVMAH